MPSHLYTHKVTEKRYESKEQLAWASQIIHQIHQYISTIYVMYIYIDLFLFVIVIIQQLIKS